jgi:hypothetical protein
MSDRRTDSPLSEHAILYRCVNERAKEIIDGLPAVARADCRWVCECDDTGCTTYVSATVEEYQAVRANPRTFLVAPGHVDPFVEHVVRGNERFTVVEKDGTAADLAELHATHDETARASTAPASRAAA